MAEKSIWSVIEAHGDKLREAAPKDGQSAPEAARISVVSGASLWALSRLLFDGDNGVVMTPAPREPYCRNT